MLVWKECGRERKHCLIYQPNISPGRPPPDQTMPPYTAPIHIPRCISQEEELFYRDMSEEVVRDDQLIRLMTFPNVLITPHQGTFVLNGSVARSYVD